MSYIPSAVGPFRRPLRRIVSITLVLGVCFELSALLVFGQQITVRPAVPESSHIKLTNGFFVTWGHNSRKIEVFDRNGSSVARIDVLGSFPGFNAVGIYDASVQPDRAIVVAAVVQNRQQEKALQVKSTLLYYDWHGKLTQAVSVNPSIERLEVDEDGNVWALLNGDGDAGPAKSPVIAVFKGDRIVNSFLNWTYFPHHADGIEEGPKAEGAPGFGITQDGVWFWLPGYDVFSLDRDGGNLTRIPMNLPKPKGAQPGFVHYNGTLATAFDWVRIPGDRFVFWVTSRAVNVEGGLYILSKKGMVRYRIADDVPVGLDNSNLVLARYEPSRNEFQIFWKHLE
ncbi:MAG: hypothetical protein LAP85_14905 [Acidobacteriia bacterium]|nr:hypothetical protein [Terriglobia bacterium]